MPFKFDDEGRLSYTPTTDPPVRSLESVTFAIPLEGNLPTVTPLPTGGKGLALDGLGQLPTSAPATALPRRTADPDTPSAGMVWIRTDLHEIRFRDENGTTYKLAGVAV